MLGNDRGRFSFCVINICGKADGGHSYSHAKGKDIAFMLGKALENGRPVQCL